MNVWIGSNETLLGLSSGINCNSQLCDNWKLEVWGHILQLFMTWTRGQEFQEWQEWVDIIHRQCVLISTTKQTKNMF
jgi:hypothetical protein